MAKQTTEFSKFKLSYEGELMGYFNTPLDITKEEALQLLQATIDNLDIEVAVSKPKESKLMTLLGKKSSTKKSEGF